MSKLCPLNFQQKAWRLFFAAKVSINVNLSTSSLVLIASNQFFFQKIIDRLSKKGFASRASPLPEKSRNIIDERAKVLKLVLNIVSGSIFPRSYSKLGSLG